MSSEVMDVEEGLKKVVSKTTTSNITVQLHPLVIMNISDHWTRIRAQEGTTKQVFGAILGKRVLKNLEIMNSFELLCLIDGNSITVDRQYYDAKSEQFKQVFSEMEFLGWYNTGSEEPNEADIEVHKQMMDIKESIVFLKCVPTLNRADVPVTIYESTTDVNDESSMSFVKIPYTVISEESERVGIDHIVRMAHSGNEDSSITIDQLTIQYNAVKMLYDRLKLMVAYAEAVKSKELPEDYEMLCLLKSITIQMNKVRSDSFDKSFYSQRCEMALITYLATITKGCNGINQFINKFKAKHGFSDVGIKYY